VVWDAQATCAATAEAWSEPGRHLRGHLNRSAVYVGELYPCLSSFCLWIGHEKIFGGPKVKPEGVGVGVVALEGAVEHLAILEQPGAVHEPVRVQRSPHGRELPARPRFAHGGAPPASPYGSKVVSVCPSSIAPAPPACDSIARIKIKVNAPDFISPCSMFFFPDSPGIVSNIPIA